MPRDDFDSRTKETLARRVGMTCSHCGRGTAGPQDDPAKSVNVGVAAHIAAASPGGKRYDADMSREQRSSIDNGIWLCQVCAKLIDDDERGFPVERLRELRTLAEARASAALTGDRAVDTATFPSLQIRVSPTRQQRRQLAQIHLFNPGPRPILITGWFVLWEDEASFSIATFDKGWLPKRLEEQSSFDFTADISANPVDKVRSIGVEGGDKRRWEAAPENIAAFIATAVSHRLPDKRSKHEVLDVDPEFIDISVEHSCGLASDGVPDIIFTNRSATTIPVVGIEIKWNYDPPREGVRIPGKPFVSQTEGSVRWSTIAMIAHPNSSHRISLPKDMASMLVDTLADDVKEDGIEVTVISKGGVGWMEKGPNVSRPIRDYAQKVVESWD